MIERITVNALHCTDCQHTWIPRKRNEFPKRCYKCGKSAINRGRGRPSKSPVPMVEIADVVEFDPASVSGIAMTQELSLEEARKRYPDSRALGEFARAILNKGDQ